DRQSVIKQDEKTDQNENRRQQNNKGGGTQQIHGTLDNQLPTHRLGAKNGLCFGRTTIHAAETACESLAPTFSSRFTIRERITVNNACAMLNCKSWMICILAEEMTIKRSKSSLIFPLLNPVKPLLIAPASLAASRASSTFGEFPLALMPKAISPLS